MTSILDGIVQAIFNPPRRIGAISIQCAIEESHYDELVITEHPVEQGALITDHAYKRMPEVTIRAGWSNSGLASLITDVVDAINIVSSLVTGTPGTSNPFNYAVQVYNQLLTLQASRQPFQIITGKRTYNNMLIRSLHVTTDEKSEHALLCTAVCRQILIATTQVSTFPTATNMKLPWKNAAPVNNGAQSLIPGNAANPTAPTFSTLTGSSSVIT